MPTFNTPGPITARVDNGSGSIRIVASDRDDTVVEVRPHDESRAADVRAAERTRVDFAHGGLVVSPRRWGLFSSPAGAVDISVELPAQSRLAISVASSDVRAEGEFGDCRFASASGNLSVGAVDGSIKGDTASADVSVDAVRGSAAFATASGQLRVQRLQGKLKARTASGSVAVATAARGEISAHTASGDIEIGIPTGTAARLDIISGSGVVTNEMQTSDGPAAGDDTLVVNVRTGSGDVAVRRSTADSSDNVAAE